MREIRHYDVDEMAFRCLASRPLYYVHDLLWRQFSSFCHLHLESEGRFHVDVRDWKVPFTVGVEFTKLFALVSCHW